jgi:hypothetical protein
MRRSPRLRGRKECMPIRCFTGAGSIGRGGGAIGSGSRDREDGCHSPKPYPHAEGSTASASFRSATVETVRGTCVGNRFTHKEFLSTRLRRDSALCALVVHRKDHALGSSLVTMMQSTKSVVRNHTTRYGGTSPTVRSLLAHSEMRAVLMIITDVFGKQTFWMAFIHRNDVVQLWADVHIRTRNEGLGPSSSED